MNTSTVTLAEGLFLVLFVFILVMSLYQACINLLYGKISKYSIDGILVFIFLKFGNEKTRKRVRSFSRRTDRILLLGVYAILTSVGAIYATYIWLHRIAR